MEGYLGFDLPRSMVPGFARGLPVLLVDHDTTSLTCLASMLEQYSYKVTTVEQASVALSMIVEQRDEFKLVMANTKMSDMDSHSFLSVMLEKNIPLILMSSEMKTINALKFLTEGACYCLEKPISMNDLKYVWQHAFRRKDNPTKETNNTKHLENVMNNEIRRPHDIRINEPGSAKYKMQHGDNNPRNKAIDDPKGKCTVIEKNGSNKYSNIESIRFPVDTQKTGLSKGKRSFVEDKGDDINQKKGKFVNLENDNSKSKITNEEHNKDEDKGNKEENGSSSPGKRRSVWNAELHRKFTAALCALGDKNARPKSILQMMNVPNLTQRQVASHLQKYKAQVQRISETTAINDWKSSSKTFDNPSNYNHPFGATTLASSLLTSNSPWDSLGYWRSSNPFSKAFAFEPSNMQWQRLGSTQNKNASIAFPSQNQNQFSCPPTGATTNRRPEFSLGGKINLSNLPLFANMKNNVTASYSCVTLIPGSVPPTTISNPSANSIPSATSYVPEANSNQMSSVPSATSHIPPANSVPSATNYVPEASITTLPGSESENQNSKEFADFLKLLGMDQVANINYTDSELNSGDADKFFDWLDDALNGNDETA